MHHSKANLQEQVRRVAVLRAAQRALTDLVAREPLERSIAEGQVLFNQLRSLDVATQRGADVLAIADDRSSLLAADLRELLEEIPLRALCERARTLADQEPTSLRALGAVLLHDDAVDPWTLRVVEALVTALACKEVDGLRRVVQTPLNALPELARVNVREIHEPHPEVAQAEQVLGREARRLPDFGLEAVRARIDRFKAGLGARVLHPTVLEASIAYNVALGNRLIERARATNPQASAATVPGPEALGLEANDNEGEIAQVAAKAPLVIVQEPSSGSRLIWQTAAVVAIASGCLAMAALLWTAPVDVVAPEIASGVSPYLVSGYVSEDDGTARFVGTVDAQWEQLDAQGRRRALAHIASRLAAENVDSIVLLDLMGSLQARQEGQQLHWVASSADSASQQR